MKKNIDEKKMLEEFRKRYGYVEIDASIVSRFVRDFNTDNIDLLYDWCLANDEHYGVQE